MKMKMQNKMFVLFITVLIALFVVASACIVSAGTARADEVPETVVTKQLLEEGTARNIEDIAAGFVQFLKDTYGEDYQRYYDAIIEQWGSVEAYLLQFGAQLPEEYQGAWWQFIGWLGEYSVVWAPILAVTLVVAVALFGRHVVKKWLDALINKKVNPVIDELNKQSKATAAMMGAQRALLGGGEKFKNAVKALEDGEKELTGDGKV